MKRWRILSVAAVAAILVAPAPADSKTERIEALEKQVAQLQQQLAALEKKDRPHGGQG
ncbi:MAG: hypothetical protein Q9Q13_04230 [Acidobacteriota bacterium]|nr:hypothetical protein [Acidobacteriota bacterium]